MIKKLKFVSRPVKGIDLRPWDLFANKDADYYNDKFKSTTALEVGVSIFIRTFQPYPEERLDHEELFELKIIEEGEENPFEEKEEAK